VLDLPTARHYVKDRKNLRLVDESRETGFCVILTRGGDKKLREQLNAAIKKGLKDGTIEKIYRKYGVWNADQERLPYWTEQPWPPFGKGK
jgi:polar amino acid transport system substrate-binding protein